MAAKGTIYNQDGLQTAHDHSFVADPRFRSAYARGVQAVGWDYGWHWRVHVALWAARTAVRLPGDFVECGVNHGFMASAIMHDLGWTGLGRRFYLLDTFSGIDLRYVGEDEAEEGIAAKNQAMIDSGFYAMDVGRVQANFAEWPDACIIQGAIPETLAQIGAERVAFLHLDMNCSPPEVAAIEHLWPRMVPGAVALFDDYAYVGYHAQKRGLDGFAARHGVSILALPTGQGLLVRPPGEAAA